ERAGLGVSLTKEKEVERPIAREHDEVGLDETWREAGRGAAEFTAAAGAPNVGAGRETFERHWRTPLVPRRGVDDRHNSRSRFRMSHSASRTPKSRPKSAGWFHNGSGGRGSFSSIGSRSRRSAKTFSASASV